MKLLFNFGNDAAVLPASAAQWIDRASKCDIKVIFALAAAPEAMKSYDGEKAALADAAGCTESELDTSVAFWRVAGVISADQPETTAKKSRKTSVKPQQTEKNTEEPVAELPKYTTEELTDLLEKRKESAQLIDECQRVVGKIFNTHEINIVLGLSDYLGLGGDYILTLFDYCARHGKKSLHYMEKQAFSLYDEGITEAAALHERLQRAEAAATLEGEIRAMFGIKSRELTTREKKYISRWICDFGYEEDVIRRAYEMTVDSIHEPSPNYANAILERWNKEGLRTLADIDAADAAKLPGDGSFDTDDFFEAALQRSFGEAKK